MQKLSLEVSSRDALQFSEILSDRIVLSNEFERESSNFWVASYKSVEEAEEVLNEVECVLSEANADWVELWDDWYDIPHLTSVDISCETEIPMKQLRGVLSSLEQKDLIQESEMPSCMAWMVCL